MSETDFVTVGFTDFAAFLAALRRLRAAGIDRFRVYSPVPLSEYESLLPRQGSPVRWYALVAGVCGCIGGFVLCLGSTWFFSLIVGGKPMASWVPFCVIAFELAVLAAGLVTMGACLLHARLYPRGVAAAYKPEFSADEFGVSVSCGEDRQRIEGLLTAARSEER